MTGTSDPLQGVIDFHIRSADFNRLRVDDRHPVPRGWGCLEALVARGDIQVASPLANSVKNGGPELLSAWHGA